METLAENRPDRQMTLDQAVWVDPERMSGAPCFRGSRLPVQQLFDWLVDGVSLDDFVCEFQIDRAAAATVLHAACQSLSSGSYVDAMMSAMENDSHAKEAD